MKRKEEMNSRLVTNITTFAVSLADFKEFIKWDSTDTSEDNTMMAVLTAATNQAELFTRRTLLRGTWRTYSECLPYYFTMDILPIVTSSIVVKYYDVNNALQTLDAAEYFIQDRGENDFAQIKFDGTMPSLYDRWEPVYIEFTAGYEFGYLPEGLKVGILKMAADYFEIRTNELAGSVNQIMFGSQQSWYPYKML